jgi:hypothetical protein
VPIDVDDSAVATAIDNMLGQLKAFPDKMAVELTDWQTEDMKRRYPNVERPDEHSVETDVWPRSRLSSQHHRPTSRRLGRPPGNPQHARALKPMPGPRRGVSTRPILREELWDQLVARMGELLGTLSFKSK